MSRSIELILTSLREKVLETDILRDISGSSGQPMLLAIRPQAETFGAMVICVWAQIDQDSLCPSYAKLLETIGQSDHLRHKFILWAADSDPEAKKPLEFDSKEDVEWFVGSCEGLVDEIVASLSQGKDSSHQGLASATSNPASELDITHSPDNSDVETAADGAQDVREAPPDTAQEVDVPETSIEQLPSDDEAHEIGDTAGLADETEAPDLHNLDQSHLPSTEDDDALPAPQDPTTSPEVSSVEGHDGEKAFVPPSESALDIATPSEDDDQGWGWESPEGDEGDDDYGLPAMGATPPARNLQHEDGLPSAPPPSGQSYTITAGVPVASSGGQPPLSPSDPMIVAMAATMAAIIGGSPCMFSGVEYSINDLTDARGMLPVILVAAAQWACPLVLKTNGKGGYSFSMRSATIEDGPSLFGFVVTNLTLSSPQTFLMSIAGVMENCVTFSGDNDRQIDMTPLMESFAMWGDQWGLFDDDGPDEEVSGFTDGSV